MSKTVVVIADNGRLIDVTGADKESGSRYGTFVKRLLGSRNSQAVLDYGWNGDTELLITAANGEKITLDAQEVVIPGTLTVGGTPIQDLVSDGMDLALEAIEGKDGEIVVTVGEGDSSPGAPERRIIGLHPDFLDRIDALEDKVDGLFRFDALYRAGDGLQVNNGGDANTLSVKLGQGLKFEPDSGHPDSTQALAVECDSVPRQGSDMPISSGAVYDAMGMQDLQYVIGIDATGNMALYDTQTQ